MSSTVFSRIVAMVFEIENKVVLVTGGAIGIGAKVVEYFLEAGAKHVVFIDILENQGITFEKELNTKYGLEKATFIVCDVTNTEQLLEVYKSVLDKHGYIDIVVNNAGIMNDNWKSFKKEIDVNVTALITSTLKAMECMRKDEGGKGGVVINISSIAAVSLNPLMPIYNSTKAAVINFSSNIGMPEYYLRTGVKVIAVCFGATDTSLISKDKLGAIDNVIEGHLDHLLKNEIPIQKVESAAKAVVEICKIGDSGSTWLSIYDKPARDITDIIKAGYETFAKVLDPNF